MNFLLEVLGCAMFFGPILWLLASVRYVKSDEVGLVRYFGKVERKIHSNGHLFIVPWFWGIDLVRITKDPIKLPYETNDEEIYSSDGQLMFPNLTFYFRFPFKDVDSLAMMVEAGVPLTEEELKPWAKDRLMPAQHQVFRRHNHKELISGMELSTLAAEINQVLHKDGSLLRECGILGKNYLDITPGTGQAFVEVEQVNVSPELRRAMAAPIEAGYMADAAKQTARMNSEQIGSQLLGTVARKHGLTIEMLETDLQAHPEKAGKPVAEGGYRESFVYAEDQVKRDRAGAAGELSDIRIGNSDGTSMSGELPAFAAVMALMSRFGGGGKGGGNQGNRGGEGRGGSGNRKGGRQIPARMNSEQSDKYLQRILDDKEDDEP